MYVRPISARLLGGRSTPATRAIYFFSPEPQTAINNQQALGFFISVAAYALDLRR
jgi:hypothetical protein